MEQRIVEFWGEGTAGAEKGERTLKAVVLRVNKEGYKVDQIIPLTFTTNPFGLENLVYGIILCTKI